MDERTVISDAIQALSNIWTSRNGGSAGPGSHLGKGMEAMPELSNGLQGRAIKAIVELS
jgi:hypothetical protein